MDVVGQLMGRKWKRCRGKVSILDQLSPDGSSGEDNGQRIGTVTRMSGCNVEMNGADEVKYRNVIADAYYTIVVSVNSSNGLKTWRVQQRHGSRLWACGMMCLKKGGPYKAR